ncbi:MAG: hypothetical protein ACO3J2_07265, partial [Chthoniobacterales bacterium]
SDPHLIAANKTILPDLKDRFRVCIRDVGYFLTPEQSKYLMQKPESLPDSGGRERPETGWRQHASHVMENSGARSCFLVQAKRATALF